MLNYVRLFTLALLLSSCAKLFPKDKLAQAPSNGEPQYSSERNSSPLINPSNRVSLQAAGAALGGRSTVSRVATREVVAIFDYERLQKMRSERIALDVISSLLPSQFSALDRSLHLVGPDLFWTLSIPVSLTKAEIESIIQSGNTALKAVSEVTKAMEPTGYESLAGVRDSLDLTPAIRQAIDSLPSGKKVRVAVIDSGISNVKNSFQNLFATDFGLDLVRDPAVTPNYSHGTMVSSVLASREWGLAANQIELIPIRAVSERRLSESTVLEAIGLATNLGAEVVVLPYGALSYGCSVAVGHMMYLSIEKGVFFAVPAGNGIQHLGPKYPGIGFPIVAASEDGPLNFQLTNNPGCWGKYFLGAVAVANLESANALNNTSNFGEDVELAALGTNIPVINDRGESSSMTGSSAAAAVTGAAAAIAIYHHKQKGYRYTPWYIENLLVESARRHPDLAKLERRTRFGSVLQIGGLMTLLRSTEGMSDAERQQIATINPRFGLGWLPGMESNLKSLRVTVPKTAVSEGEVVQAKAVVYYTGTEPEANVSANPNIVWQIGIDDYRGSEPPPALATVGRSGLVQIDWNALKAFTKDKTNSGSLRFKLVAVYSENQHQVYAYQFISPVLAPPPPPQKLMIVAQLSRIKTGDRNVRFQAFLEASPDGSSQSIEVTGATEWLSSEPNTFRPTLQGGIYDALLARIGGVYQVTAKYSGQVATLEVKIEPDTFQSYEIFSTLGNGGNIHPSQTATFVSRLTLGQGLVELPADWYLDGAPLAQNMTRVMIDGKALALGEHRLKSVSKYYIPGAEKAVTAEHTFRVEPLLERIEVTSDRVVMAAGGEALINLRAYFNNNSYRIITGDPDIQWQVSPAGIATVQASGKMTAAANAAGKQATVTAKYKGYTHSTLISITTGSIVTGSTSDLVALEYEGMFSPCYYSVSRVYAVYKDGKRRNVTGIATAQIQIERGGKTTNVLTPENWYPGMSVIVDLAYNDGSTASGGGGNVQLRQVLTAPPFMVKETWLAGSSFPHYAPVDPWQALQYDYCAYGRKYTYSSSYSGSAKLGTAPIGSHSITANWYSNSTGAAVLHSKTFPFTVSGAVYAIVSGHASPPSPQAEWKMGELYEGFPVPFNALFGLKSAGGYRPIAADYVSTNISGSVTYSSNGVRDPLRFTGSSSISGGSQYDIRSLLCFERPIGAETATIVASDKESNTTAQTRVLIKTSALEKPNFSQIDAPVAAVTDIPAKSAVGRCSAGQKNALPFGGGQGTLTSPYIICSPDQLDQVHTMNTNGLYFELGEDLDFTGRTIASRIDISPSHSLDGKGFELRNITLVDAERDNQAPLRDFYSVKNLRVANVVVRGRMAVGAVCAGCSVVKNVYVTNINVSGQQMVGAISGSLRYGQELFVRGGQVASSLGSAGGLVGRLSGSIDRGLFEGVVRSIAVPNGGMGYGGLVGVGQGQVVISNSSFIGNVVSANRAVAGIVGAIQDTEPQGAVVRGNRVQGNVVGSGDAVGGVVGEYEARTFLFLNAASSTGADHFRKTTWSGEVVQWERTGSGAYIGKNTVGANIWGGMSFQVLKCLEGVVEVLGQNGSVTCDGDIVSSSGGTSATGGIVGLTKGGVIIGENRYSGNVRSANESGGVIGRADSHQQNYQNSVSGNVSVSKATGVTGKILGRFVFRGCRDLPASYLGRFVRENSYTPSEDLVSWHLGEYVQSNGTVEKRVNFAP